MDIRESQWLNLFKNLSQWMPPSLPTIILSPHPDDETLGAGGLITNLCRAKIPVRVIAVTDGEHAYQDVPKLGQIRKLEQEKALKTLGLAEKYIVRLHLADSSLHQFEDDLRANLLNIIRNKCHILAPWIHDFHPDHEILGRVATEVAKLKQVKLTYYFFWTWYKSDYTTVSELPLKIYPLNKKSMELKENALQCYRSQLQHPSGQPILTNELLCAARRPFEVFLPL